MALITHDYYCPRIGMAAELRLLVPDGSLRQGKSPAGTLFLLSPPGESGLFWLTDTDLRPLAETYGIAVILVPCLQGCYTDMAYGYPFYRSLQYVRSYVREQIPGIPLEPGRTAIAGASVGGAAALRWGMEEPDFFSACASFSGLLFPDSGPRGWFTEERLLCLYGDEAARKAKKEAFLTLCGETAQKRCYLSAAAGDPGAAESEAAAAILGDRAVLHTAPGVSDRKRWSDRLAEFLEFWRGGAAVCH